MSARRRPRSIGSLNCPRKTMGTIPDRVGQLEAFGPEVRRRSVTALWSRHVSAGELVMRIGASRAVKYNER